MSRFLSALEIAPHPLAPHFTSREDAKLVFSQLISELSSPNPQISGEALSLLREAGLVNLYFLTKYILGAYGQYSYLNDGLQLDMCNFRQSPACMRPGARAAFALFRGSGKSDISTICGSVWELLRDPSCAIGVANAKVERAEVFTSAILAPFLSNDLVKLLWPAYCAFKRPPSGSSFVLPNRPRFRKEASVKALGCTGSTEGDRFTLLNADDLVGLDDVNADNTSTATMAMKKRWFQVSEKANMADLKSRYVMEFTTFGAEGVYDEVFKNLREVRGSILDLYSVGGSKKWSLYIRDVIEDGRPTLPEVQTIESLESLRIDNPVLYYSQYRMRPQEGGLMEFKDLPVGRAELVKKGPDFFILFPEEEKKRVSELLREKNGQGPKWEEDGDELVLLAECSRAATLDPAGTARSEATSKSSKSSLVYWARDSWDRSVLLWECTDYLAIQQVFDKIHDLVKFFEGLVEWVGIEKAAMQKIIRPVLEKERNLFWEEGWVGFRDLEAGGDKIGRIRWTLAPVASRGMMWVCRGTGQNFLDEFALFPMSKVKVDALDASEKALKYLRTPESAEAREWGRGQEEESFLGSGRSPVTGY